MKMGILRQIGYRVNSILISVGGYNNGFSTAISGQFSADGNYSISNFELPPQAIDNLTVREFRELKKSVGKRICDELAAKGIDRVEISSFLDDDGCSRHRMREISGYVSF